MAGSMSIQRDAFDHSQSLSFKVKAEHHFFIFKLIGVDGIKAPIWASKDGLGQVYFK